LNLEELISKLSKDEYEAFMEKVYAVKESVLREEAQDSFMAYVKMMWPGFVGGRHHSVMAKKFEAIARGDGASSYEE